MNGVVGADVAELRVLATALDQAGERLVAIHGDLTRRTDASRYWLGPDAARFRERWRSSDALRLRAVATSLAEQADRLRRNADEQERASAAEGSGVGSGPSSAALQAPRGISALYSTLRVGGSDGLRIQEVLGDDRVRRYIVYMNGTGSAGDPWNLANRLTWPGNIPKYLFQQTDPYILEQMRRQIPQGSEVMLVGYSQGGIDAQNIAALGRSEFNVTDVVTFGSPTVAGAHPEAFGTNVLHVRAWNDPVPMLEVFEDRRESVVSNVQSTVISLVHHATGQSGQVTQFVGDPGYSADPFTIHGDARTYVNIGGDLDANAAPQYEHYVQSQSRYQGTVVNDTDDAQ